MNETFIAELEQQLRAASGRRVRLASARLPRPSVTAAGVIITLAVVIAVSLALLQAHRTASPGDRSAGPTTPPTARAALTRAAAAAARGTLAPVLGRGQGWYVAADEYDALQPRLPFATGLVQKWFSSRDELGRQGGSGWQGESAGALGFADWDPGLGTSQVQALAPTPGAMLALTRSFRMPFGYLPYDHRNGNADPDGRHGAFTQLAQLGTLLAETPLRPAARAAAYHAIATLPGLRYLGAVTATHRGTGVAVAEVSPPIRELPQGGPDQPRHRYRFELIFDPETGRVLGWRTRTLDPLPSLHVRAGGVVFAWTLRRLGLVRMARVRQVLDAERVAGQQLRRSSGPCVRRGGGRPPVCRQAIQSLIDGYTRALEALARRL